MIVRCSLTHLSFLQSSTNRVRYTLSSHHKLHRFQQLHTANLYRKLVAHNHKRGFQGLSDVRRHSTSALHFYPASTALKCSSQMRIRSVLNSIGSKIKSLRISRPPLGPLGAVLGHLGGMANIFRQGSAGLLWCKTMVPFSTSSIFR